MKWTLGLALGLSLVPGAIACTAPSLQPTSTSSVSSTLATYKATSETTKKYGITKWRLRNVGDGSVLEGLDAKGKSVSHISIAVRKGKNASAAMFWFKGKESSSRGFVSGTKKGLAEARVSSTLPSWANAARRDLEKFAAEGKTPYGCAEDIFGILGSFLKEAPKCAKSDTLNGCIGKLTQGEAQGSSGPLGSLGGIGGILGSATKLLTSCKPASPPAASSSSSSSSGGTTKPAADKSKPAAEEKDTESDDTEASGTTPKKTEPKETETDEQGEVNGSASASADGQTNGVSGEASGAAGVDKVEPANKGTVNDVPTDDPAGLDPSLDLMPPDKAEQASPEPAAPPESPEPPSDFPMPEDI